VEENSDDEKFSEVKGREMPCEPCINKFIKFGEFKCEQGAGLFECCRMIWKLDVLDKREAKDRTIEAMLSDWITAMMTGTSQERMIW
jgi:hypothetical protein